MSKHLYVYVHFTKAGQNAVFECDVEGATKVTWLKDNRPLSERLSDRVTMSEENQKYRLEIRNCTELDSGTYTARAENDCGVSYSTAHLVVEKCKLKSLCKKCIHKLFEKLMIEIYLLVKIIFSK